MPIANAALDWIRRTVETYGWRLHAFVVMSNHDHLFVETPEANLGPGMQFLNGSYTSYFNRRHRRVGHLFQGRFRSHLVDEEGYFLEVSRYIPSEPGSRRLGRTARGLVLEQLSRLSSQAECVGLGMLFRRVGRVWAATSPTAAQYARFVQAGIGRAGSLAVRRRRGGAAGRLGGFRRTRAEVARRTPARTERCRS